VLTTESDLSDNIEKTKNKLASFIGVNPDEFPERAGKSKKNKRHLPKFKYIYSWAVEINKKLKRSNIY
jgi:hypothetical protein